MQSIYLENVLVRFSLNQFDFLAVITYVSHGYVTSNIQTQLNTTQLNLARYSALIECHTWANVRFRARENMHLCKRDGKLIYSSMEKVNQCLVRWVRDINHVVTRILWYVMPGTKWKRTNDNVSISFGCYCCCCRFTKRKSHQNANIRKTDERPLNIIVSNGIFLLKSYLPYPQILKCYNMLSIFLSIYMCNDLA